MIWAKITALTHQKIIAFFASLIATFNLRTSSKGGAVIPFQFVSENAGILLCHIVRLDDGNINPNARYVFFQLPYKISHISPSAAAFFPIAGKRHRIPFSSIHNLSLPDSYIMAIF
jgi:hypothetical protein